MFVGGEEIERDILEEEEERERERESVMFEREIDLFCFYKLY